MISLRNFLTDRRAVLFFGVIFWFSGCVSSPRREEVAAGRFTPESGKLRVAVLPVQNMSRTLAPLADLRQMLTDYLGKEGIETVEKDILDKFIYAYRLRYVGGVNRALARAIKQDTGADAILVTTIELFSDRQPPKIAILSRLISAGDDPRILWADGIGLSGDASPGILGLSLISDDRLLMEKSVRALSASLSGRLSMQKPAYRAQERGSRRLQPLFTYTSPIIGTSKKYRVAVIPLFNVSQRKYAGDIMGLHFVKELFLSDKFKVIEPGIVRDTLLNLRIVMDDGLSLAQADILASQLNADLILTGRVLDYQDFEGIAGKPKVGFSALFIEKNSREVAWNVKSYHEGDRGVFFFDMGKIYTAHAMASAMVQRSVETMVRE